MLSHSFADVEAHAAHVVSTQAIAVSLTTLTRALSSHGAVVLSRESMSIRVFPITIRFCQTGIQRAAPSTFSSQRRSGSPFPRENTVTVVVPPPLTARMSLSPTILTIT